MGLRLERPLISVITPFHNGVDHLREAVSSVFGQTYAPVEMILVDDGSTENFDCPESTPECEMRLYRQHHRGRSAARNEGVRKSTGPYLAFLDSDDVWALHKLEKQLGTLEMRPDIDGVFVLTKEFFSPDVPEVRRRLTRGLRDEVAGMIPSALLIRRARFLSVGSFDERHSTADWADWYARAIDARMTFDTVPEVLLFRRVRADSSPSDPRAMALDYAHALRSKIARNRR